MFRDNQWCPGPFDFRFADTVLIGSLLLCLTVVVTGFVVGVAKTPAAFERAAEYELSQQEMAQ